MDLPHAVRFQVVLASSAGVDISAIDFTLLSFTFSDSRPDLVIWPSEQASGSHFVDAGAIGHDDNKRLEAPLRWDHEGQLVVNGELEHVDADEVQVITDF